MGTPGFTELKIGEGAPDLDVDIHRVFRLFRENAEKRTGILLDISKLLCDNYIETNAGDIFRTLIDEGIYDILSEAFEKESDDSLLKAACVVSALLCEMISFEKVGSEFRRVRFIEHLSRNSSVRISGMEAVKRMMKSDKKMGEMIYERMGKERMVEKVKMFVEGEKKGKREVELEEMCGVIGVIGEMVVCGVDVGEEDELVEMVRWIEEEGMKREDEEGEEGEGWRRLGETAVLLNRRLLKKKGKGMSLRRAMEEIEKKEKEKEEIRNEKEDALKEKEEMKKEKEDALKREEALKREIERIKREHGDMKNGKDKAFKEKEALIAKQKELEEELMKLKSQRSLSQLNSLDLLRVVFNPDQSDITRNGNTITHTGSDSRRNIFMGDVMTNLSIRCYVFSILHWDIHKTVLSLGVPKVDMYYHNDSVEFISLERLAEPRVTHIDGEEALNWE